MTHDTLDSLRVIHRLKDAAGDGLPEARLRARAGDGVLVDTCLRQVVISASASAAAYASDRDCEVMHGVPGYHFLLQTVTGLNSSVPGETNVQGQFRRAWEAWSSGRAGDANAGALHWIMQRLFADARRIRRDYLQDLGGTSYGSLLRKLLSANDDDRILFVGAGELAHSVLPWFETRATGIWNHRPIDASTVPGVRLFAPQAIPEAARWATHIVFTTPPVDSLDAEWAEHAGRNVERVVHLGRRRANHGVWNAWQARNGLVDRFSDLDDLFELQKDRTLVRSLGIRRARRACEQLAFGLDAAAPVHALRPLAQGA